jgi:hypothetical protein
MNKNKTTEIIENLKLQLTLRYKLFLKMPWTAIWIGILSLLFGWIYVNLSSPLSNGLWEEFPIVKSLEWPNDQQLFNLFVQQTPRVFTKHPALQWKAMNWAPHNLAQRITKIGAVKCSKQPNFMYRTSSSSKLADFLGIALPWNSKYCEFNASAEQFFRLSDKETVDRNIPECLGVPCNYLYFSSGIGGEINELGYDIPLDDAVKSLFGNFKYVHGIPNFQPTSIEKLVRFNLWMGSKGTFTNAHYDSVHNFFIQVYGKKKFLLFPPNAIEDLYVFPKGHPSARQSRINFESSNAEELREKYPNFLGDGSSGLLQGYEVTLNPGEMLYVPPGWFHAVWAKSLSISLSFWQSDEDIIIQRMILEKFDKIADSISKSELSSLINQFLALMREGSLELNPNNQPKELSRIASRTPVENIKVLLETQFVDYSANKLFSSDEQYFSNGCNSSSANIAPKLIEIVKLYNLMPATISDIFVFDSIVMVIQKVMGPNSLYPFLNSFVENC